MDVVDGIDIARDCCFVGFYFNPEVFDEFMVGEDYFLLRFDNCLEGGYFRFNESEIKDKFFNHDARIVKIKIKAIYLQKINYNKHEKGKKVHRDFC